MAMAAAVVVVLLVGAACSSTEADGSFATGSIVDDGGAARSWAATSDGLQACLVIEDGASACVRLDGEARDAIDAVVAVEHASSAIIGRAPIGTTSMQIDYGRGITEPLSVVHTPDDVVVFAGAIGFDDRPIPVTIRAFGDTGALLGSEPVDLAVGT